MDVKICKSVEQEKYRFTAILDDRGRITIPACIRKKLRLRFASSVDIDVGRSSDS